MQFSQTLSKNEAKTKAQINGLGWADKNEFVLLNLLMLVKQNSTSYPSFSPTFLFSYDPDSLTTH